MNTIPAEMESVIEQILAEVAACVRQVSAESLAQAEMLMETAPRIFVAGVGRSGLCMRALGMRLMHLGKTVYVVGETITPSIAAEDLLILGSGSGRTTGLLAVAEKARRRGRPNPALHDGCDLASSRVGRSPDRHSSAVAQGESARSIPAPGLPV